MSQLKRFTIDPITRIEGHLRIEVDLDPHNVVKDAYSSSGMFRGIELIMQDRDFHDVGLFAQRICGVCTFTHYRVGTEAVEAALQVQIPTVARIVRNLLHASLFLHDHVVHFYQLHGMDWFDVVAALRADPVKAAAEALKYSSTPYNAGAGTYRAVQQRVAALVSSGELGPFANGYWGNPSYKLTPEQDLIMLSHYLDALSVQRTLAQAMAVFGGKNPHPQSLVVGGVTSVMDIVDPSRVAEFLGKMESGVRFVQTGYVPDMRMVAEAYAQEARAGEGYGVPNFISYGAFPLDNIPWPKGAMLFPMGVFNRATGRVTSLDAEQIKEDVTRAWYQGPEHGVYPGTEATIPDYTGYEADGALNRSGKYSWIKAPRYDGMSTETGPLARLLIGRALHDPLMVNIMEDFEHSVPGGFSPDSWYSTVGRTAARALEADIIGSQVAGWVDELAQYVGQGETQTYAEPVNTSGEGFRLLDAPRGALGHWIRIDNSRVTHYQAVVPSTWNASPRDHKGQKGPYEAALVNTRLAIANQPLEVLRTVHSFDPCIACAVHIIDSKGAEVAHFQVDV
ncbi:MAG: nickel-dependent hydrogenase large subunit [Sulfobacillus thermotolerans]|uniref:Hydrogenase 2 large subunit n=1 Tax=Sulfobacillus thermotolerans TaxID=338644 RepID=A0ABM6RTV3_9FIRM|nr:hydrogenase 2 large subunit [Sulfobacillus thermotolerans]MCY0909089.1 nickel-dependent hydrogenase large subunit [Sulfobacillus thermotolerans]